MPGSIRRKHTFDGDDALRELMSSMLSGRYKEETYLGDVCSVCRSRPESVPRLIALVDRYMRLGRMPASQHAKVRAKIDQVMAMAQPVTRRTPASLVPTPTSAAPADSAPADSDWLGNIDHLVDEDHETDDDDLSEESLTREFSAQARGAAPQPVLPVLPASIEPQVPPVPSVVAAAAVLRASAETRVLPAETRAQPAAIPLPQTPDPAASRVAADGTADASSSDCAAGAISAAITSIGAGTILHGRYELQHLLGRGGIATVYKAVDRYRVNLGLEDCYVAVKVVQPHPSRPGSVAALGREFHNAQLLSHPNVINVFNIDHAGDTSFYTMELLDGERLSQLVKRVGGVLPRRYALTILRDIGAAVAHAHSRGVVHADLKPHNVMITSTGQVRVLDFGSGLIRAREPWISELSPGETYRQATPAYASCEQLEGWSADPRDDIYALACLAYLLLTGRHPFDMQPSLDARAHKMQPRRPPYLKGESWRALKRGLSWTREQRTMAVEDWLRQLGVNAGAPMLPPLSLLHAAKPSGEWLHRAAAAAAIVMGLGLAAFTVEHRTEFDWPPTLTRAHDKLNGALRGMQSLADTSDTAGSRATPATAVRVAPAAAAAAPLTVRKDVAPAHNLSGGSPHPSRSAMATANLTHRVTSEDPVTSEETTALAAPIASADAAEPDALTPRLEFSAASYLVPGTEPAARIVIRRNGSTDGDLNFVWWTEEGSARPDVDYASLGRRIERIPSGSDRITVYVPIISTPQRQELTQFYVALSEPGSQHNAGQGARSVVTIDHGS